jgi:hypothetical protein
MAGDWRSDNMREGKKAVVITLEGFGIACHFIEV